MAKLGNIGKYIRNTWKVLKCAAGKLWRRQVGPIAWKTTKYYKESRRKGTYWIQ